MRSEGEPRKHLRAYRNPNNFLGDRIIVPRQYLHEPHKPTSFREAWLGYHPLSEKLEKFWNNNFVESIRIHTTARFTIYQLADDLEEKRTGKKPNHRRWI